MENLMNRRGVLYALAAMVCVAVQGDRNAFGALATNSSDAMLQLPVAGAGQTVTTSDFAVLLWIRPSSLPETGQAGILEIDGVLSVRLQSDGSIAASVYSSAQPTLSATTGNVFPGGQINTWALVAISFDRSEGSLTLWAHSELSNLHTNQAVNPAFTVGPPGSSIRVGASQRVPAMVGTYGLIALRDHTLSAFDIGDLWEHRRHHGPYSRNNTALGGTMNGEAGCVWMINHAMTTRPLNLGAGGEPHEWAAVVGEPVTTRNVHVYDTSQPQGTSLRAVRAVMTSSGFVHHSPFDSYEVTLDESTFFIRTLPQVTGSFPAPPHHVARVSPKARLLATPLPQGIGHVRVLASANSRAIQAGDGSATGTGNFAHGFLWNNLHRTAGVINRPARVNAGPWFGLDGAQHQPHVDGVVTELHETDFSRYWTSAGSTNSTGPGEGVHLKPGATFTMRCRPQGMIHAEHPLVIQAHLLKFPGASNVNWQPNKHTRQGEAGTGVGKTHTRILDTQTFSHVFDTASGDQVLSATRIALAGDLTSVVTGGLACHVGPGSISVTSAVSFDGERTIVDFQHPFRSSPAQGSTLRFGPWGFETIWHRWDSLQANDDHVWRGLEVSAGDGEGVVLFSFDAWRPSVDGFLFGVAGWGGMGYEQQMARSFSGMTSAWASRLNVDVWLQMFATQLSHPSTLNTYANQVRQGIPGVEVVWLGDIEHPSTWDTELWHWWALTQANSNHVVSSTLLIHPKLGSQLDLFADGIRSDVLHTSQRGNQRLATLWTEVLLEAALPGLLPKKGDLDQSGSVDVSDLLILLGQWGQCANLNTCSADLNGDGHVDVTDLLLLFGNWG